MPIHDWTRVDPAVFHDFHFTWISATLRALNSKLLPQRFYAMAEPQVDEFGPDVETLRSIARGDDLCAQAPDLTKRKVSTICVRSEEGDHVVAVVDAVSPIVYGCERVFESATVQLRKLLAANVHVLMLDLVAHTRPVRGDHFATLWAEASGRAYTPINDKPLAVVAFEANLPVNIYIETLAVGDRLPDFPLFLGPASVVEIPLEATYQAAFDDVPSRWRRALESPSA